jgi:hypothetical protein
MRNIPVLVHSRKTKDPSFRLIAMTFIHGRETMLVLRYQKIIREKVTNIVGSMTTK